MHFSSLSLPLPSQQDVQCFRAHSVRYGFKIMSSQEILPSQCCRRYIYQLPKMRKK